MARKRIVDAPVLKSWADVDAALHEIAEKEITLGDIEGDMNKQINGIKKIAEQDAKPHQDRIDKLSKDIKEFVEDHRAELGNKKTQILNFGSCGFRQSTNISVPKAKEKLEELIRKLKARKMSECIITKETVDKEALRKYGEDTVNAVGAGWKQKDVFWYETAREKFERAQAAKE
ncbi:host-nuclease inhibitor Gam family protein [Hungatella effluvii]|uniref:host-nuclease inhibitor Gam family protein n=1 Tax=Hungatella effluvii TaxID=1096246 RepID=UPI0022DF6546|nr:host-nuclease inhibitor Gam family protein [Hungatella effluvii]